MDLKNKQVMVIGLAVTGVPLVKFLVEQGSRVIVNDIKSKEQLKTALEELKDLDVEYILEEHPADLTQLKKLDLVVVSPGVPLDIPFIRLLNDLKVEIIGEIELAYRFNKANIVAITGTNGKTTTTALTGAIFENAGVNTYVVGNIGIPAISKALLTAKEDAMIMEISSFQLESVKTFHPKVAAILNLTPDHLNRHKTMENYRDAKFRIFQNQDSSDYAIINFDNEMCKGVCKSLKSKPIYFSRKTRLEEGVYVENGKIVVRLNNAIQEVIPVKEIRIPGEHNLENALAATAMAYVMGIKIETIANTLRSFQGVEHRLEFVDEIEGVKFINDSKGTNPDASIKAIEAVPSPIILLAGGHDKGSDYSDLISSFDGKVKYLIVYGETADKIENTARLMEFNHVIRAINLDEAVHVAYNNAESGDTILLSPASASWDMYKDFQERGMHFKEIVSKLRRS